MTGAARSSMRTMRERTKEQMSSLSSSFDFRHPKERRKIERALIDFTLFFFLTSFLKLYYFLLLLKSAAPHRRRKHFPVPFALLKERKERERARAFF
jgi:hypothetical protein